MVNKKSVYKDHPPYEILPQQVAVAKKLKVRIEPSTNKMKKLDVIKDLKFTKKDGEEFNYAWKVASIGGYYQDGKPYGDYWTYKKDPIDRYGEKVNPEDKRRRYLVRHEHENKETLIKLPEDDIEYIEKETGKKYLKKKFQFKGGTPSYYADKILW